MSARLPIPAAGTLRFASMDDVSGADLRVMDRVTPDSPWLACIVNGVPMHVRLAMKSGRVVAFKTAR